MKTKVLVFMVLMLAFLLPLFGCGGGDGKEASLYFLGEGETIIAGSLQRATVVSHKGEIYSLLWFYIPQSEGDTTSLLYFDQRAGGYSGGGRSYSDPVISDTFNFYVPEGLPAGAYTLRMYLFKQGWEGGLYENWDEYVLGFVESEIFNLASPSTFGVDTDASPDYTKPDTLYFPITSDKNPDLFQPGWAHGEYMGSPKGVNFIFGEWGAYPSPYDFSSFYDHCTDESQLNEAFITEDGKLGAIGVFCPYGCSHGRCVYGEKG